MEKNSPNKLDEKQTCYRAIVSSIRFPSLSHQLFVLNDLLFIIHHSSELQERIAVELPTK